MAECPDHNRKTIGVGLIGASFDTGNMGVSALAESSVKCILHRWPDAEIMFLGSSRVAGKEQLRVGDRNISIKQLPIRFCPNVFVAGHAVTISFYLLLLRLFRWEGFREFCCRRNSTLAGMTQMRLGVDITGGDSFSDIYGMHRFVIGFLRKWLVLLSGKDLVLLPQTYGPFKRRISQAMARYVLRRAKWVYSRDPSGVEYVNALLGNQGRGNVRFVPDVAFVLDARKPERISIEPSADIRAQSSTVVGLNISGLLFNGGYNRSNMFGLKSDYRRLVCSIADMFLQQHGVSVLLVPHVFPSAGNEVESDYLASREIYEQLHGRYPNRIFIVQGQYDHSEVKYMVGLCDFFVGARMHSCIAALSQCIPAVGMAYSKKFEGVFDGVGLQRCVVDMRDRDEATVIAEISHIFRDRDITREHLLKTMPRVKERVLSIFEETNVQ